MPVATSTASADIPTNSNELSNDARHERIEVSLFGPGYGESIAVHLGNQAWMIVDSCLDAEGAPAAIAYLLAIGVDPSIQVKAIVVTHWDDDHVRGISKIVELCPSADVWLPAACQVGELMAYVGSDILPTPPGLRELKRVMQALSVRAPKSQPPGAKVRIAVADAPLHDAQMEALDPPVRIWALSPGPADIVVGTKQLRKILNDRDQPVARLNQNDFSVVLHLQIGELAILLGGDRLSTPKTRGWNSVLLTSRRRGVLPAGLLKIPHHGSSTGEHPAIWNELTTRPLVSILTPNASSAGLPRDSDVERIAANSDVVVISSFHRNPDNNEQVTEFSLMDEKDFLITDGEDYLTEAALVQADGTWESAAQPPMGQVRCWASARGGDWEVQTLGPAQRLKG